MGSVLGVRALAGAPLPQLAVGSGEDGFLLVGAVAFDVGPHEVKELACSGYAFAAADLAEREPRSQGHAETLDRRFGGQFRCSHGRYITAARLRCHVTRAIVGT